MPQECRILVMCITKERQILGSYAGEEDEPWTYLPPYSKCLKWQAKASTWWMSGE